VISIAESNLLGLAEVGVDGVARGTRDGGLGVGDDLAVLDVETLDLVEDTIGSLEELGDDGELGLGVDSHARSVEVLDTLAVRVEVASIGIASTGITGGRVSTTAGITLATVLADSGARVRSVGGRDGVGLPDIHLSAARAVLADTSVLVVGRGSPLSRVGLTVDELEITRALSIAVTGTILGTSLVGRVLGQSTILVHGHEVESTVETASDKLVSLKNSQSVFLILQKSLPELGHIDIEGELVTQEGEHLVLGGTIHEIETRSDVGGFILNVSDTHFLSYSLEYTHHTGPW
jgi:hypothetical protein